VLPFHSSFFEAAIQAQCPVVPLAIRYSAPGVSPQEEVIYWKDRRFIFHVIRLLGVKEVRARLTFGEPMEAGDNRKQLSGRVRNQIVQMVEDGHHSS
jgi:1-acyl-sn-glycerol-3-phosphate acyltransferase